MSRTPLFITRKFPPSLGGMETLSASVWRSLRTAAPSARKISHGGSNIHLVWWIPIAIVRLTWLCLRGKVSYVLCGDAVMNAVSIPVLRLFKVPSSTMVMGLDITYDSRFYRAITQPQLRAAEHVIAISEATATAAREVAGVRADRISVLRLGVQAPSGDVPGHDQARTRLVSEVGLPQDALILVMVGRLVRRKGAHWFVSEVFPSLPAETHLVIAGSGPDADRIQGAASAAGVTDRVHLLGTVNEDLREVLMAGGDLFIQPNIKVPGDMEGFGLVVVEAAFRDTPVLASALEGIRDAVVDGVTGLLIECEDADVWRTTITDLLSATDELTKLGDKFGAAARDIYSEGAMGRTLVNLMAPSARV